MSSREREPVPVPPQRHSRPAPEALRATPGEALPAPLAAEMGARFGVGFGDVRVHRDAAGDRDARSHGAQAVTRGREISFAAGRFDPSGRTGRDLLAHELAHVVQQREGGAGAGVEGRADRAAAEAIGSGSVNTRALGGAPVGVHAKPDDSKATDTPAGASKPEDKASKDSAEAPANGGRSFSKVLDKFALDKDTLTPEHRKAIEELAFGVSLHTGLLARGKARIEIVGHADTSGTEEHNLALGQDRANRVKDALEKALTGREGPTPPPIEWSARSAGESEPLIPTGDDKREPRNRRVEVRVTIESMPAPKPPPSLDLDPRKYVFPDEPPIPERPRDDDLWKRMQENQRKIDEYNRAHPDKPRGLQDVVIDGLMDSLIDPLLKKLPVSKSLRDKARGAIRDGLEAGTEKACEAAVDATGAKGEEADALKAACKAAIKSQPGAPGKSGGGAP